MRLFVTGTDTNIGKTVACAWLCHHTRHHYFKPIQTGTKEGTDTDWIREWVPDIQCYPEIYAYPEPASPHWAAALEQETISLKTITLPPNEDALIVEGAGGVLVPLNETHLMIDLMKQLDLPVLVVASTRLGTLNHTLLTLDALRQRHLDVSGVLLIGPDHPPTQEALVFYGKTAVLGHLPWITPLTPSALRQIPLTPPLNHLFKRGDARHAFVSAR